MKIQKITSAKKLGLCNLYKNIITNKTPSSLLAFTLLSSFVPQTELKNKYLTPLTFFAIAISCYIFKIIKNQIFLWRVDEAFKVNISELKNKLESCHQTSKGNKINIELEKYEKRQRDFRIKSIKET